MYHHLRGVVVEMNPTRVVVECGGVGWDLIVPLSTSRQLPARGQEVTILTHLVVREDELTLYGFLDEDERSLFRCLIGLSGVGPALALQVLSAVTPVDFAVAVERQDADFLKRIKGIGGKKANQIILGLKGAKMRITPKAGPPLPGGIAVDAVAALVAMEVGEREATERVERVIAAQTGLSLEDIIKKALQ